MEKIKSACIKYRLISDPDTDRFVTGYSHGSCIDWFSAADIYPPSRINEYEVAGFMTTEGRFVDRIEAYKIAEAAGQLIKPNSLGSLHSYEVKYSDI